MSSGRVRRSTLPAALALALMGCMPVATGPSASPTAPGTPAPTAVPASAGPSAAGSPSPSPAATAAPATPQPGPAVPGLADGKTLRRYDFKGIGGLYVDPSGGALHVLDAVNEDVTPRRYMLRRFKRDGTFEVAVGLGLEEEQAPDAVDGYAFGAFGTPFYTHRDDERLVLRRLYTATPRDAVDFPGYQTPRAGLAALRAEGTVVTLATLRLDPEEKLAKTTNKRFITYVQADPEREPTAIFQVPDPLVPTRRMALGPGGALYLLGTTASGSLGCKRLEPTQQLSDVALGLTRMPDLVTVDPAGRLWLVYNSTGAEPATVAVHEPGGALLRSQPVTLADGGRVFEVRGLAFDRAGVPLVGGRAMYSDLSTVHGIFEFKPRP